MDTVQYLEGDWNNRNKIKTSQKPLMLTVPIDKKKSNSKQLDKIIIHGHEEKNSKEFWQRKHWESIRLNYKKSSFFKFYESELEDMYLGKSWKYLVDLCWFQFNFFRKCLGLDNREVIRMSKKEFKGTKDDLVLNHCKQLDGNAVVFGIHGKDYVGVSKFTKEGILVYFQNYIHPEYKQRFHGFEPNMSVLDLLLNYGPEQSKEIIFKKNISKEELKQSSLWINYKELAR